MDNNITAPKYTLAGKAWIQCILPNSEPQCEYKVWALNQHFNNDFDDWYIVSGFNNDSYLHCLINYENYLVLYSKIRGTAVVISDATIKVYAKNRDSFLSKFNNTGDNIFHKKIITTLLVLDDLFIKSNKTYYYINNITIEYHNNLSELLKLGGYVNVQHDRTHNVIQKTTESDNEDIEDDELSITDKRKLKHDSKNKINKKFKVGAHYYLRGKTADGSEQDVKEFVCKKYIYTINNQEVNSLVVKQISGINNAIFTLNRYDCKKLHIKYEPGLQVFSMLNNWILKNEKYK